MPKVALTGGAYQARSVIASAQRSVNLFMEPMPEGQSEPTPAAHYPTPGLRKLATLPEAPIRGIYQAKTGGVFVVAGSGVYSINTGDWSATKLGSITAGLRTPVSMADNTLDLVIVDGTANGWHVTLAGNAFAPVVQAGTVPPVAASANDAIIAGRARYTSFTAPYDALVSRLTVTLVNGYAGHMKCSIFDNAGAVSGSANELTNPATGSNAFTFAHPVSVSKGATYWVGFVSDQTLGTWSVGAGTTAGRASTTAYKDFPVANAVSTATNPLIVTVDVATDPAGAFAGATRVDYLDTYLLFNKPGTPQFYSSDSLALTFDPLWFANKSAYSDTLQTLIVAKRDIWLIGEISTEVWVNVGKPDFPFETQADVFIDHGTPAKYSIAGYDNAVFWLASDRAGQGIVIQGSGYQAKRVSTYAIEAEIGGYGKISDAIGFCYQLAGHAFYVLTFPSADRTWCYDIGTGHWHEWVWLDANGAEHRHRANCCWNVNGVPVVGDWQNGNLYALDLNALTDDGRPIKRLRSFPHLLKDGKRMFYRQFLADLETGTAPLAIDTTSVSTFLACTFTAADGTALADYSADGPGAVWSEVAGTGNASIFGGRLVGNNGASTWQAAGVPPVADYSVRFKVIPPDYATVTSGQELHAIARATGPAAGYRVTVSTDGTQYTLTLDVAGGSGSISVSMGTISSGYYTVWLRMLGSAIRAQVQRSVDALWLRDDGSWRTDPGTNAARLTDTIYTAAGRVMIGGTWP